MKSYLLFLVNSRWFNRLMLAVILLAGVLAGLETNAALGEGCGALLWGSDTVVRVIMLNLSFGIIMNSMAEMHTEIEECDRRSHRTENGQTTLQDELGLFERQIEELKRQATCLCQRAGSNG